MSELLASAVPVVGRALLHFLWQGAVVGALAAIALRLLRDARPQARYAVACLALLACALLPLWTIASQLLAATPSPAFDADGIRFVDGGIASAPIFDTPILDTWRARLETALPDIVALWAAGASALSLRLGFGVLWLRRLRATAPHPLQARWQARLDLLARRFGLRGVALRIVDTLDSPVSAGWWRPVVLLPMSVVARMPADMLEALLAHELAHVRRHDYLVNLLQNVLEALLFFHPVVWWLSHRMRVEREHVADRLAADAIGDPRRLAHALAALSELQSAPSSLPHLAQAAHGGHLMSRIQHLVRPGRRQAAGRLAFPLLGVAAACIAFYAQAQIGHDRDAPVARAALASATPAVAPVASAAPVARVAPAIAPVASSAPVARTATAAPIAAVAATSAVDATPAVAPVAAARPVASPQPVARIPDDDRDSFAIVRKGRGGDVLSGSTRDMAAIEAARLSLHDDFIWFRRGDQAYVIDDPDMVARARAAWRDTEALGERMEVLGDRMAEHGKKMEAYGAQMEKLAGGRQPSPAMHEAQEHMQALAGRQQELAGQQMQLASRMRKADEAEHDRLEREMEMLGERMDAIGEQMERQGEILERESAQLQRNQAPMEALGRRMEEASKPMEALGEQMEALGEEHERVAGKAQRQTQALIAEAMRKGLAKPAPGTVRAR